ncbi:hypothetical protein STCU_12206 [Strigomonas culicis]|uniref:Uncharacterized protein n=1 Tax=Strigomonas culicis TaxID=28005 RepID=S9UXH9_9TRYP|nr:hypothetical protein STCU_12206 [Strigomonas culicis]|eukprot:EPY15245.1 hypothetical protein STCU_12206 [Strigomonas culicis]
MDRIAQQHQQQHTDGGGGGPHAPAETRSALPAASPFVAYYARHTLQLDLTTPAAAESAATLRAPAAGDASLLDLSAQVGLGTSMASRLHNGAGTSRRSLVMSAEGNDTFNPAVLAQRSHHAALRQLLVLPRETGQQRPLLLQGVNQEALRRQQARAAGDGADFTAGPHVARYVHEPVH